MVIGATEEVKEVVVRLSARFPALVDILSENRDGRLYRTAAGSYLVVSRNNYFSYYEATLAERESLWSLLELARELFVVESCGICFDIEVAFGGFTLRSEALPIELLLQPIGNE